ncbi:MAG: hypothetical protein EA377_08030 [Phycisphaerales bacterium]|nr:MAG: hypothetical protein EA377_08030 [Phycisphaerales bacterium]
MFSFAKILSRYLREYAARGLDQPMTLMGDTKNPPLMRPNQLLPMRSEISQSELDTNDRDV